MPIDKEHRCVYECSKDVKCECSDCNICQYNPNKKVKKKQYYAHGEKLMDGTWQSYGWTIEANTFSEAAYIAEMNDKIKIHTLSDNMHGFTI